MMACDRHVGNLTQFFTVKPKSPAQQKPPSSSHLLKLRFFSFVRLLEQIFSLKEVKNLILLLVKNYITTGTMSSIRPTPLRVKRAHAFTQTYSITSTLSFIWVLRQMQIFYTAQCLKWSLSRDMRDILLPSAMSLSATYCPEMSKRKEKTKPSHTNWLKLKYSDSQRTHGHTQARTLKDLWASRAIRLEEVRGCEIAVVWDFLDSHNLHWLQAPAFY